MSILSESLRYLLITGLMKIPFLCDIRRYIAVNHFFKLIGLLQICPFERRKLLFAASTFIPLIISQKNTLFRDCRTDILDFLSIQVAYEINVFAIIWEVLR